MGTAYRASGRTLPVMDGLAIHPYPDNSSQSPDFPHPRSTSIGLADYGKLVSLLGQAFDGTAQPGSSLPILYDEFGIESTVPDGKRSLYTGTEPTTTKPVDEYQQAAAYDLGLRLAFCQPNVAGVLLFHSQDETALLSWQSGVYYADGTPKASFWAVRDSLDRTRGGSITRCDGLALDVSLTNVRFPGPREFRAGCGTRASGARSTARGSSRRRGRPRAPSPPPCAASAATAGRSSRRSRAASSARPRCGSR